MNSSKGHMKGLIGAVGMAAVGGAMVSLNEARAAKKRLLSYFEKQPIDAIRPKRFRAVSSPNEAVGADQSKDGRR